MCARSIHKYTKEFKEKAVELSRDPDVTIKQVAEELNIRVGNLYRWRGLYRMNTSNTPTSCSGSQLSNSSASTKSSAQYQPNNAEDQCVRQIKQKIKQIESEKRILTKALRIIEKK